MPRKPRVYLPDIPCHVVQRGNNRNPCFFTIDDYRHFLSCMHEAASATQVAIHAYVLMTNHVHLLLTPTDEFGISRMIQSIGRRYVQYINRKYDRTGTLWESRHKASPVEAEAYLLACYRYIELNPVRAGLVNKPEEYPWSSYLCHAFGDEDRLITDHPVFESLAVNREERARRYQDFVQTAMTETELRKIRNATKFSMPLGSEGFKQRIQVILGRPLDHGRRGHTRYATGNRH